MITFGNMDFEVGNMTLAAMAVDVGTENAIKNFVQGVMDNGGECSKETVDMFLRYEDIDYFLLPQYLKDEIDKIEVY